MAEGAEASGGDGGAAAAAGGGGAPTVVIDDEGGIENPCPICLDNEDDATVDGKRPGMCSACGQSYCGACCNTADLGARSPNCPTCRAPFNVSGEENFTRRWKLVHDRSPGRHTPIAQCSLGEIYSNGEGVEQDHVEAVKCFRKSGKSAEAGVAHAQYNLGIMHVKGEGVEEDYSKALKWVQLAGAQRSEGALKHLDLTQQHNVIPTPPPGKDHRWIHPDVRGRAERPRRCCKSCCWSTTPTQTRR